MQMDIATKLLKELNERERIVQKLVLALAGVALIPAGTVTPDLAKTIAHS